MESMNTLFELKKKSNRIKGDFLEESEKWFRSRFISTAIEFDTFFPLVNIRAWNDNFTYKIAKEYLDEFGLQLITYKTICEFDGKTKRYTKELIASYGDLNEGLDE